MGPTGFLPDALVCSVTVESGDARVTRYFHANEKHVPAERARAAQVEELAPVLARLEELAARMGGKAS